MSLYQNLLGSGFLLPSCHKHFHDSDETWIVVAGSGAAYAIDPDGHRHQYALAAGDVWMIPVGWEHGSDGPNSEDFRIVVFHGSIVPTAAPPGHQFMEQEGYIPQLRLERIPTNRYRQAAQGLSGAGAGSQAHS